MNRHYPNRFLKEVGVEHPSPLSAVYAHPNGERAIAITSDGVAKVPGIDDLDIPPHLYRGRLGAGIVPGVPVIGDNEHEQWISHFQYLKDRSLLRTPHRLLLPVQTEVNGENLSLEDAILRDRPEFIRRLMEVLHGDEREALKLFLPYCGSLPADQIAWHMNREQIPGGWVNGVEGPLARRMNAKIFAKELNECGFPFPETELITDFTQARAMFNHLSKGVGVMLKPNFGASGIKQYPCTSYEEVLAAMDHFGPNEYVMQSFVPGLISFPSATMMASKENCDVLKTTTQTFTIGPDGLPTDEHNGNLSNLFLLDLFPEMRVSLVALANKLNQMGYNGTFGVDIYLHSKNEAVLQEWAETPKGDRNLEQFLRKNRGHIEWSFGEINARFLGASRGVFRDMDFVSQLAHRGIRTPGRHWQIGYLKHQMPFDELMNRMQKQGIDWDPDTLTGAIITHYHPIEGGVRYHWDVHANTTHKRDMIVNTLKSL